MTGGLKDIPPGDVIGEWSGDVIGGGVVNGIGDRKDGGGKE